MYTACPRGGLTPRLEPSRGPGPALAFLGGMVKLAQTQPHSGAWIAQTWISFVVSIGTTALGVYFLPVDAWMKAFFAMGLLFSVGSTITLSKTLRDVHESSRLVSRVEEARMEKLLADHDPLK